MLRISPYLDWFGLCFWNSPDTEKYGVLHRCFTEVRQCSISPYFTYHFAVYCIMYNYIHGKVCMATCICNIIYNDQFLSQVHAGQLCIADWLKLLLSAKSVYMCACVYLFVCMPTCLSVCLPGCLPACQVCLSVCLKDTINYWRDMAWYKPHMIG